MKKLISTLLTAMLCCALAIIPGSAAETYTVTVQNGSGSGEYEEGAVVTITADVIEGKTFRSWTGDGVKFGDASNPTTTFVMPAQDVTAVAEYDDEADEGTETAPSPTPAANAPAPPVAGVMPGNYADSMSITLFAAGDIYYTLDGSDPRENGTAYAGSVWLEGVEGEDRFITIRTACEKDGVWSEVAEFSYYIIRSSAPSPTPEPTPDATPTPSPEPSPDTSPSPSPSPQTTPEPSPDTTPPAPSDAPGSTPTAPVGGEQDDGQDGESEDEKSGVGGLIAAIVIGAAAIAAVAVVTVIRRRKN